MFLDIKKWITHDVQRCRLFLSFLGIILMLIPLIMQYFPNWGELSPNTIEWYKTVFLNIGCGILGSLLIIYLYNQMIDERAEEERISRQETALTQLHMPFIVHIQLLIGIYKSVLSGIPDKEMLKWSDFFDEEYFSKISNINFCASASEVGDEQWCEVISKRSRTFRRELREILVTYVPFLSKELVELTENLANSKWMEIVPDLPNIIEINKEKYPELVQVNYLPQDLRKLIFTSLEEHIQILIEFLGVYNKTVSKKKINLSKEVWGYSKVEFNSGRMETNDN